MAGIPVFDLKFGLTPTIVIISPRGGGKSFLCRDLINSFSDYPAISVICPTDRESRFYSTFLQDSYIHYSFNDALIDKIIKRQEDICLKALNGYSEKKKIDPRLLLVLDDVMEDKKKMMNSKALNKIFVNGRHFAISIIIIVQESMGLSTTCRNGVEFAFIPKNYNLTERKKIHQHYGGIIGKFSEFEALHEKLTTDRSCMVISNKNGGGVYWYKAKEIKGQINIGNNQFKNFHNENYKENWIEENKKKYKIVK